MKKVNLIALLTLVLSVGMFSQTSQKKWAVSVGAGASNHSFEKSLGNTKGIFNEFFNVDNWSISLVNLKVGRFLTKGIVADLSAAAGSIDVKAIDTTKLLKSEIFVNAGVGIQLHPLAFLGMEDARIDPYGRLGLTYNYFDYSILESTFNNTLDKDGNTESDWANNNHFGPTIGAGVNLWVTKNIGLGLESNYNWIVTPQIAKGFNDSGNFWNHSASLIFKLGNSDKDGDGILDKEDSCPEVAGIAAFNGCPDTDSDGLQDSQDNCPTVAGPKENNGCPWNDSDGDTITDNLDKCPKVKGELANAGCPWGDKDNDGVKDNVDKCPNEAGSKDNDGCPIKKVSLTEEAQKATDALQNLLFDSGKATIRQEGEAKLDAAATIIKATNGKYLISGHTDASGAPAANNLLSKNRAAAVVSGLEARGVEKGRLLSIGYGSSQPVADNASPEGKQANRRVQVSVLSDEEYSKISKPAVKKLIAPAKKKK